MRVNSAFKGFFNNRLTKALGVVVLFTIFLTATSFTDTPERDLWAKRVNLMIRQMGHHLLLQSGDSTSRVLPVTETSAGAFQLTFENKFHFSHDSLIALSLNYLPKKQFPSGYTLTVHEGRKPGIIYGFQFNNKSPDIVSCEGRSEPFGKYRIEVAFPDLYKPVVVPQKSTQQYSLATAAVTGVLVLLGITLIVLPFTKRRKPAPVKNEDLTSLGKFLFDAKEKRLLIENEAITLTEKECRVLELLNKNFGELILRETLMQEVWINEGVITGRSLDVFVSKLRKKLSGDPELRITNVHGKGYKLDSTGV